MPLDLHDALHPIEGPTPEQPPLPLGAASSNDDATEGSPPFLMRRLSLAEWQAYVTAYVFTWRLPSRLVLHHTWRPNQSTWNGYTSMRGMQRYYAGLGWTSAPHIYCAPDGIWLATPLSLIGIHAGRGNGSVAQGWYSIGIEMVGDFDHAVPSGAVWERTRAVLGGLQARVGRPLASVLSFHRDYSDKSCPGDAVTRAWVLAEMAPPQPAIVTTPASPILGPATGTPESAIAYLASRATQYEPGDVVHIVNAYRREGSTVGVDWFLALAQMAHETDSLRAALSGRYDKDGRPLRNPAGIGISEPKEKATPHWRPGTVYDADVGGYRPALGFARWDPDAVRAHLGRLLAYALPEGQGTPEQQAMIDYALKLRDLLKSYRGAAQTISGLSTRWAPSSTYHISIIKRANAMRGEGR